LPEHDVSAECARLEAVLAAPRGPWFVVSNEVGWASCRTMRSAAVFATRQGRLNQRSRREPTGSVHGRRAADEVK
jgi:adenosylcobinamide kinase/adenosylcobinamide-phosphate guanylyltransferase